MRLRGDDIRHHVNRYVDGKLPTQREQRRSYRRVPFFDVKLSLSVFKKRKSVVSVPSDD